MHILLRHIFLIVILCFLLQNNLRAEVNNVVEWEKELNAMTEKELAMELAKKYFSLIGDTKAIIKIKELIDIGKYYEAMEVLGKAIADKVKSEIVDKTPFGKYKTLYEIQKDALKYTEGKIKAHLYSNCYHKFLEYKRNNPIHFEALINNRKPLNKVALEDLKDDLIYCTGYIERHFKESQEELIKKLISIYKKYDKIVKRAQNKIEFLNELKYQLRYTIKKAHQKSDEYYRYKEIIHNFESALFDHEISKRIYEEKDLEFLENYFKPDLLERSKEVHKSNKLKENEKKELEEEFKKLIKRTDNLIGEIKERILNTRVVPYLIGRLKEEAKIILSKRNLQMSASFASKHNPHYGVGIVLSQSPEAGSEVRKDTIIKLIINPEPSIDIKAVMKMGDKFQEQQYGVENKRDIGDNTEVNPPIIQPDSYTRHPDKQKSKEDERTVSFPRHPYPPPYPPLGHDSEEGRWTAKKPQPSVNSKTRSPNPDAISKTTLQKTELSKKTNNIKVQVKIEYFVPKGNCIGTLKGNKCLGKGWTGYYMELHEITVFDEKGNEIGNYSGKTSNRTRSNSIQGVWTEDIILTVPKGAFYVEIFGIQWSFAEWYPKDWCVHHFIKMKAFAIGQAQPQQSKTGPLKVYNYRGCESATSSSPKGKMNIKNITVFSN